MMQFMKTSCLLAGLAVMMTLTGCGSREFTQGKYDDLAEDRLLDDKFNESDMRKIADTLVASLVDSPVVRDSKKPPIVLVTLVKNFVFFVFCK